MEITYRPQSVDGMYKDCKLILSNLVTRGSSSYTKTKDMYEFYVNKFVNDVGNQVEKAKGQLFPLFIVIKPASLDEKNMKDVGLETGKMDEE